MGQLGLGSYKGESKPTFIAALTGKRHSIIDICVGENHSLALDETGRLWAFGCNKYGQVNILPICLVLILKSLERVLLHNMLILLKKLKDFLVSLEYLVGLTILLL